MPEDSFSLNITKWADEGLATYDFVRKAALIQLFGNIIKITPFDTGRARNNWNTNIGSPDLSSRVEVDGQAKGSLGQSEKTINSSEAGDTIFLNNSLPYIHRLEFEPNFAKIGAGWMRGEIINWQNAVEDELKKLT